MWKVTWRHHTNTQRWEIHIICIKFPTKTQNNKSCEKLHCKRLPTLSQNPGMSIRHVTILLELIWVIPLAHAKHILRITGFHVADGIISIHLFQLTPNSLREENNSATAVWSSLGPSFVPHWKRHFRLPELHFGPRKSQRCMDLVIWITAKSPQACRLWKFYKAFMRCISLSLYI